jgi:prophage antirepressor-like protein
MDVVRHLPNFCSVYGKKKVLMVNYSGMKKLIFQGKTPTALRIQQRVLNIAANGIPVENRI